MGEWSFSTYWLINDAWHDVAEDAKLKEVP